MTVRRWVLALALAMLPGAAQAQTFNQLYEYGNAKTANATSGAGIARGADFSQSASGIYTITAGGTDFWDKADHGSAIFDNTATPVTGNFSAIAKVAIGLPGETLPGEWGRSGIMARVSPAQANSAYFAAAQKFNGPAGDPNRRQLHMQGREVRGGDTSSVSGGGPTSLVTGETGAGVPVWLGLHRYEGSVYATWAPDVNGAPGAWSRADGRGGSAAQNGPVQLGLFHQNHDVNPQTSTATFSNFKATDFSNALGQFPLTITRQIGLGAGSKVTGKVNGVELGGGAAVGVSWKVEVLGAPQIAPGLWGKSFLRGNPGTNFDPNTLSPQGEGVLDQIAWWGNDGNPPAGYEKYPAAFNLPADTNNNGDNQENYSADVSGQIFIPEPGTYKFKDGVDDYTFLSIDGQALIDDNNWTSPDGSANGGSPIVSKEFTKSGWYDITFRMAEGGGGDSGVLYWDYKNAGFPAENGVAATTEAIVPAQYFRHVTRAVLDTLSGDSIQDGVLTDASGKTLTVAPGTLVRFSVNGLPEVVELVPEPASLSLGLLSALGLLGFARRRR